MATYTDNYNLIKPTYAETADIGPLNNNFEKIDEVMHSSQTSLAPAYDQTKAYSAGDVVMYELLMYKCTAPTTGVWDPSKWERTTASESGGGGSAELDILGEGNGAVVSFSDGASAELAKCIVEIVPKQDLHGYDKPWAGGAGKNKCPLTVANIKASNTSGTWSGNIYSISNCTFEILTDSDKNVTGIKVNSEGTASQNISFNVGKNLNYTEELIFSGCPSGGSNNTYMMYTASPERYDTGNGITIQYTSVFNAYIYIKSGYAPNNLIFYPMLRLSTASSGYEPYSNICPISGHSSVTINVSPTSAPSQGLDTTIQLGQTVYGGQLNVLTGELTVTHAFVTIDGSEAGVSWTDIGNNMRSSILNIENLKSAPKATGANADAIANYLEKVIKNYSADVTGFYFYDESNIYVKLPKSVLPSADTSGCTQYLQSHNLSICYKLLTPQTVQLTPTEIATLLGQNYISADTGDVDIVYVKASAPIQPNPTGTPTATLKKLGIEGTVFEVEGGGGGSSSGIHYSTTEQVIGTWIDGKPLYQITKEATINLSSNDDVKMSNVIDISSSIIHKIDINIRLANGESFGTGVFGNSTSALSSYACGLYISNGSLRGPCVWGNTSTATCQVTVQYTKITD